VISKVVGGELQGATAGRKNPGQRKRGKDFRPISSGQSVQSSPRLIRGRKRFLELSEKKNRERKIDFMKGGKTC